MNKNKRIYFYRGNIITPYKKGWFSRSGDLNIYKTINDAKNAIDKHLGGFPTAKVPKRNNKPIKIIGIFED